MTTVPSMLDQMLFLLPCGHDVVLGREGDTWTCEQCGKTAGLKKADLTAEPLKSALAHYFHIANQIDRDR